MSIVGTVTFSTAGTVTSNASQVKTGIVARTAAPTVATFAQTFSCSSGAGTAIDSWVQTSFDGGNNWIDLIRFMTINSTSTGIKIAAVSMVATTSSTFAPSDGSTSLGTSALGAVNNGYLGSLLRVKATSTGTWAGNATISVYSSLNCSSAP